MSLEFNNIHKKVTASMLSPQLFAVKEAAVKAIIN